MLTSKLKSFFSFLIAFIFSLFGVNNLSAESWELTYCEIEWNGQTMTTYDCDNPGTECFENVCYCDDY